MSTKDGAEIRIGIAKDAVVLSIASGDSDVESSLDHEQALQLSGWLMSAAVTAAVASARPLRFIANPPVALRKAILAAVESRVKAPGPRNRAPSCIEPLRG